MSVDEVHNEIVLEDENLDQIVSYGRLDNTPAQAAFTEPKRVIGGSKTEISENCGLYNRPTGVWRYVFLSTCPYTSASGSRQSRSKG